MNDNNKVAVSPSRPLIGCAVRDLPITPFYDEDGITIYNADCKDVLPHLQRVNAVITDPPYGTGNFDWDNVPPIAEVISEIAKNTAEYVAVFGQMPQLFDWHQAAQNFKWHFCEHIVWVKRQATPNHRVQRGHESVFIYAVGKHKSFYQTKGAWEDVKLPGLIYTLLTVEGVDRYVKDLRNKANGKPTIKRDSGSRNTDYNETRYKHNSTDRSPEFADFTNVWSFLPERSKNRDLQHTHPTIKPLEIMKRLIEMLTPEGGTILDPFLGSGTTLVAAKSLGRKAIGIEISKDYCQIAVERLKEQKQQTLGF